MYHDKKTASHYRRVQRFLAQVSLDYDEVALFLFRLFELDKVTLSIDRTNWQWGNANINIFMLSVVYKGIAIPLYWQLLNKRGNSNAKERIALVQRFIDKFGTENIDCILADREFVGNEWFQWLNDNDIGFCIRIKKNSKVTNRFGRSVQVHTLLRQVMVGECFLLNRIVKVHDVHVRLFAYRNKDNELMIVATNDLSQTKGIDLYAKRWEIETLFSCFKSRGFNLEETHLTQKDRIKKLIAIFSIAFCWCYKVGIRKHEHKPIQLKNHGRLTHSLFRYGLDTVFDYLKQAFYFNEQDCFDKIVSYLCPDTQPLQLE